MIYKLIYKMCMLLILFLVFLVFFVHATDDVALCETSKVSTRSIPLTTRIHWMRAANKVLSDHFSPCPFGAFAAAIVNHTEDGRGKLVCTGINQVSMTGNPTAHGEMMAIDNCTTILTAQNGSYRLSPKDAMKAFSQLSIYSNGESCPMCASAIRWAGFKEYIYGTSISTLVKSGWYQIHIESYDVFLAAEHLNSNTAYIGSVLSNETDPLFLWQYNQTYPCPSGCYRTGSDNSCEPY